MQLSKFIDGRGRDPTSKFISQLDKHAQKQIYEHYLALISRHSYAELMRAGKILKKLQGYNLYEIRIKLNKILIRILCEKQGEELIMLHAFQKNTARTPKNEIEIALNRKSQY